MKKVAVMGLVALAVVGCRREMYEQPRSDPLKSSDLFANGAASRPLPAHTVPQENFHINLSYDTGRVGNGTNYVNQIPFPVTRPTLEQGRKVFNIYCAVCHGQDGQGKGMVVTRGFPAPPAYSIDRLRNMPVGYFFDVMTRGYGVMFPYANRVSVDDRWAVAAYIRVLQLSHHATISDVPKGPRAQLE